MKELATLPGLNCSLFNKYLKLLPRLDEIQLRVLADNPGRLECISQRVQRQLISVRNNPTEEGLHQSVPVPGEVGVSLVEVVLGEVEACWDEVWLEVVHFLGVED